MTLSIDFNSPVIIIPGYESKYDFAGASNSLVRIFDDYLEARIVQQFHFWLWLKKGGVILRGFKWIYKALIKLMNEAIVGFSEYQVRKAIANLGRQRNPRSRTATPRTLWRDSCPSFLQSSILLSDRLRCPRPIHSKPNSSTKYSDRTSQTPTG